MVSRQEGSAPVISAASLKELTSPAASWNSEP